MAGKALAIVSGKGGSGKTIIATEIAVILAEAGKARNIVLVDADIGTGGLSLYLGINEVRTDRKGLSTIILEGAQESRFVIPAESLLKPLRSFRSSTQFATPTISLLPVGDFRSVNHEFQRTWAESSFAPDRRAIVALATALDHVIADLRDIADLVIVDCRGGIDDESIAVCEAVDDLILVGEADATAFNAGLNLIDVLAECKLANKVRGLIFNKVYSDPTPIKQNSPGRYDADLLALIPFDLNAARAFAVGNIPETSSPFATHLQDAINKIYPEFIAAPPESKIWNVADYDTLNVFTPGAVRASVITALFLLTASVAAIFTILFTPALTRAVTATIAGAIGVAGALLAAIVPLRVRRGR